MRLVAGAALAIAAAVALAEHPSARADEANPFPSPSPVASTVPGQGGYAAIGVSALSASGGAGAAPAATGSPVPFASGNATGYSIELLGRLSPSYLATLRFEDASVHRADNPVVSRFDVSALRQFGTSHAAVGVGYASLQRSTFSATSNGLGVGVAMLPDFTRTVAPYGSIFLYPSLAGPASVRASLSVVRLGLTFSPARATGLFARIGFSTQHFGASTFSPTSMSGVELGIGTTF